MSHTQTVAGAFDSGLYASGFALVRPMLEALLKQAMLGEYKGDDDGWKKIPDLRIRVTRANLKALEFRSGWSDILPWWENVKPVLNDFVHGGRGQLTSNPIDENGWPQVPRGVVLVVHAHRHNVRAYYVGLVLGVHRRRGALPEDSGCRDQRGLGSPHTARQRAARPNRRAGIVRGNWLESVRYAL